MMPVPPVLDVNSSDRQIRKCARRETFENATADRARDRRPSGLDDALNGDRWATAPACYRRSAIAASMILKHGRETNNEFQLLDFPACYDRIRNINLRMYREALARRVGTLPRCRENHGPSFPDSVGRPRYYIGGSPAWHAQRAYEVLLRRVFAVSFEGREGGIPSDYDEGWQYATQGHPVPDEASKFWLRGWLDRKVAH